MIHVTCGIIEQQGKLLICQRSATMKLPLKWEFPGGKVEENESNAACLAREIYEELGLTIRVGHPLSPVIHHYPTFSITLYPYFCELRGGSPQPTEHAQVLWVSVDALLNYDWAEADIPVVHELLQHYGC